MVLMEYPLTVKVHLAIASGTVIGFCSPIIVFQLHASPSLPQFASFLVRACPEVPSAAFQASVDLPAFDFDTQIRRP